MNKYSELFDFLDEVFFSMQEPVDERIENMYQEVRESFNKEDKPLFTEAGLQILEYLQSQSDGSYKAKDIADGMGISSRKISGAIRKLVSDGYVSKAGQNPVAYSLTEQGRKFNITSYKKEND